MTLRPPAREQRVNAPPPRANTQVMVRMERITPGVASWSQRHLPAPLPTTDGPASDDPAPDDRRLGARSPGTRPAGTLPLGTRGTGAGCPGSGARLRRYGCRRVLGACGPGPRLCRVRGSPWL